MATYNGENYLQEQLKSFLNQTRTPDELVVSDDGSTDRTLEIIKNFKQSAPFPVKIYSNCENLGCTKNFEKALVNCSGDLIFLSDQDDVWLPEKLEKVESEALNHKDILVFVNDMEIADGDLNLCGVTKMAQSQSRKFSEHGYSISGCATAIRSSFVPIVTPFPNNLGVAHDVWIHKLSNALRARLEIQTSLQIYRRHNANLSFGLTSQKLPLKWWKAWLHMSKTKTKETINSSIEVAHEALNTIREKRHLLPKEIDSCQLELAENFLANKLGALKERNNILKKPRPMRIIPASIFLLKRKYRFSRGGTASFLKDLFQ